MKCDLHVHSIYSGMCSTPVFKKFCRESYSQPEEVYARLKSKGMDLVTLTDHDSIDGAEILRKHPDFFISEEVTCEMPSGTQAHIGVYNLSERQHIEIQRRRKDLPSLLAYLSEARLFFAVNHVFSSLTGRRAIEDFYWFEEYFPAFEVLNGQMLPFHNRRARERAHAFGKAGIGGSDAHVVRSAGAAYTEVPGVETATEFFQELKAGNGSACGGHGNYWRLTRDILSIARAMLREKPLTALLLPLIPLVPVATLAVLLDEMNFARSWARRLRSSPGYSGGADSGPGNQLVEGVVWP